MGKGFNNYMTKKFFHPASKDNIKRVWMAKQKTDYEKKKQDDLMSQYQREQEMLSNRALLGDEKAKLGLSFLYDAPPGMKSKEKEDNEPEYKFEWQRKYNAPREAYAKGDDTISDQPFGIEVRNIRCIKCRQWGHVNTDKICPLFGKNLTAEPPKPETSTSSLLEGLKEDGFQLKQSMLGRFMASSTGEMVVAGEEEEDPEVQFLKSLTPRQKKKLLKKLNVLQKNGAGKLGKAKKDKKKKKSKKKSHSSDDSDSSDGRQKKHKKQEESSNSSDEERYKAQGARPKKIKREQDTEGRSRKHRHRDSSDSDFQDQKSSGQQHGSHHKPSIKQEKRVSVKQEKRSRSPEPRSSKKKRRSRDSSDSDSSVDNSPSPPPKPQHRDRSDRRVKEEHSRSDRRSTDKHSRRDGSRSPETKSDRHRDRRSRSSSRSKSLSPLPKRQRERSASPDRQRDRRRKQESRKKRDSC